MGTRSAGGAGESAIQQVLITVRSQGTGTSHLVRYCFESRLTSIDRAPWGLGLWDGADGWFPGKAAHIPGAERWGRTQAHVHSKPVASGRMAESCPVAVGMG